MLHALDRFVLNKYEKSYQFLQRHFGLKVSTAIDTSLILTTLSLWSFVYFFDQLKLGPTVIFVLLAGIQTIAVLLYIFLAGHIAQDLAEKFAARGVSNPFKIDRKISAVRCGANTGTIFCLLFVSTSPELAGLIFSLQFIFVSYCSAVYLMSIDILPPSSSKEDSWLRNLFRRRVTST